jgi:hypothetical protein
MNPSESARYENMLSAQSAAANAGRDSVQILRSIDRKLDERFVASRAAVLSEWTDRDMTVGNVIYKVGSVTIADILDHAAREAEKIKAGSQPMTSSPITDQGWHDRRKLVNEARKMWTLAAATLDRDVLLHGLTADEQDVMIGAVLNAAHRSSAPPVMGMEEMVERAARALAKADGKDPDAPAWVEGYGNRARTFGICWRDQYAAKARAALEASGLLSTPLVTGRE